MDHILSDLSTMTRLSWVAPRAWLSFIELDKAVVLVSQGRGSLVGCHLWGLTELDHRLARCHAPSAKTRGLKTQLDEGPETP